MKIIENKTGEQNRDGTTPACRVKGSELAEVADWLWNHDGEGYAFAIMLNMVSGTYPVPEKPRNFEADVLCLDELFDIVADCIGAKETQERLNERRARA